MVTQRFSIGLIVLAITISIGSAQPRLPDWAAAPLGLSGVWERATFVAVGDLQNIRPLGVTRPRKLPRLASSDIPQIHWCTGDFVPQQILRGTLRAKAKVYLWGAIEPGCKLDRDARLMPDEMLSQVWFIREEEGYLRPVVDAGGPFFFTFHVAWGPHAAGPDSERYFGSLLLSPSATGLSPEEYAQSFIKPAGLACWILGRADCIQRIRDMATTDNRKLHDAACEFLYSQFHEGCTQ